jgi:hypothetical protein
LEVDPFTMLISPLATDVVICQGGIVPTGPFVPFEADLIVAGIAGGLSFGTDSILGFGAGPGLGEIANSFDVSVLDRNDESDLSIDRLGLLDSGPERSGDWFAVGPITMALAGARESAIAATAFPIS